MWVSTETSGSQRWLHIQIVWGTFKTPDATLLPRSTTSKFLWVGPRNNIYTLTPRYGSTGELLSHSQRGSERQAASAAAEIGGLPGAD